MRLVDITGSKRVYTPEEPWLLMLYAACPERVAMNSVGSRGQLHMIRIPVGIDSA